MGWKLLCVLKRKIKNINCVYFKIASIADQVESEVKNSKCVSQTFDKRIIRKQCAFSYQFKQLTSYMA